MADPYQVDDEGRPVAEADADVPSDSVAAADAQVPEADPDAQAALRRQIEQTLRFMRLQTVVGLVVIVVLAVILSDVRGVLVLVGIVYLLTSLGAYWYLRRNFMGRLKDPGSGVS